MSRARTGPLAATKWLLSLIALIAAMSVIAEEKPKEPNDSSTTQLPEVNVEGKRNPFEDSDRRLRELLEKSTPCIGCDAKKPEVPPSIVDKIVDTATYLITPQASKPKDHDENNQDEVDRSAYELRHPPGSNP